MVANHAPIARASFELYMPRITPAAVDDLLARLPTILGSMGIGAPPPTGAPFDPFKAAQDFGRGCTCATPWCVAKGDHPGKMCGRTKEIGSLTPRGSRHVQTRMPPSPYTAPELIEWCALGPDHPGECLFPSDVVRDAAKAHTREPTKGNA